MCSIKKTQRCRDSVLGILACIAIAMPVALANEAKTRESNGLCTIFSIKQLTQHVFYSAVPSQQIQQTSNTQLHCLSCSMPKKSSLLLAQNPQLHNDLRLVLKRPTALVVFSMRNTTVIPVKRNLPAKRCHHTTENPHRRVGKSQKHTLLKAIRGNPNYHLQIET